VNTEPENDQGDEVNEAEELEAQEGAESQDAESPDESAEESKAEGESSEEDESLGTVAEIEESGPCKRVIKGTVANEKIVARLDAAYDELVGTVSLPGFRRGRVPRRLLEKRYGEEVNKDIQEQLLHESFAEVNEEHDFRLLGAPKFDDIVFAESKDFTYTAEVQVHPEFELPKYKGLEIDGEAVAVEDGKVDEELESLRKDRWNPVPIEPSEAGEDDQFVGTYKLFIEDNEVKESNAVSFVPSEGRLEYFEVENLDGLVKDWDRSAAGTSDGAPLTLDVTVPAGYPDEMLRGKDTRLEFTLEQTHRRELPEIDEEFAQQLGCETPDELRKTISERLEKDGQSREDRRIEDELMKQVVESVELDLPTDLIENQRKTAEESIAQRLVAEGKAEEEIEKELAEAGNAAADRLSGELKEFFVLERIGEKEKIVATEEEVNARVQMMAYVYQMHPTNLMAELKQTGRLDEIRLNLRNEKVKAFLRKKAKIKLPEGAAADDANAAGERASQSSDERASQSSDERASQSSDERASGETEREEEASQA